jgi:hypothetical protein
MDGQGGMVRTGNTGLSQAIARTSWRTLNPYALRRLDLLIPHVVYRLAAFCRALPSDENVTRKGGKIKADQMVNRKCPRAGQGNFWRFSAKFSRSGNMRTA